MTSVTGEEAGQYLCVAENEAGVAEEEVTLNIQRPPTVSMEPRGVVQVRLGERMALRCSVTGDPTPTIVWTKIGAEGPREVARGAEDFVVRSMRRKNEGTYACMASSPAGEVEERVQVYVSEDAGGFNQGGRPNSWDQGGRPNPYDQGNQGRQPNPYDQGNQGGRRPNAWDQGARGDQGNPWNQGGQRSPQGIQGGGSQAGRRPPVVQSQGAKDFVVAAGNNMRLDANVTGNMASDITVEWVRQDGRAMSSRHQQRDSTLYIENADYEDGGVYVCRGRNSQGNVVFEFLANLVIATAPSIRLEPATQTVSPGDSPSIECQLIRGDQPVDIEWERQDGQPLSSQTVIARGSRLQFRNIAVSDAGRYVCRASNNAGTSQAVAEVIVDGLQGLDMDFSSGLIFGPPSGGGSSGPSRMEGNGSEIQTFTSALGGSVTLPCRLTAGPDLVWSREGGELPVNHQVVRTSLTINGVGVEDSGRYICTSQGRTQYVDLNIERRQQQPAVKASNGNPNKPDISVSESSSHPSGRPAVGHSFEARCEVDGIGNAGRSITWERMGGQMPDSFTVENNVLRSDSLTEDSAGVYRCKVETRKGMFFEMYTLAITGDM